MSLKMIAAVSALAFLGGCSGRIDRVNPFQVSARAAQSPPAPEGYVWARNDGRRMSGDPVLLRQGQKDQKECRDQAAEKGGFNQPIFTNCMQRRGYSARPAG
jgi:hypothetical protein